MPLIIIEPDQVWRAFVDVAQTDISDALTGTGRWRIEHLRDAIANLNRAIQILEN